MGRLRDRVVLRSIWNATREAITKERERHLIGKSGTGARRGKSDTFYRKEGRFSGQV